MRKQCIIVQTWNLTFDLLTPISIGFLLRPQVTFPSSIIIVGQNIIEFMCGYDAKFRVQIWPWLFTFWPQNQERSSLGHCQQLYEVSSLYVKNKWSYCVETLQSLPVPIWPWPLTNRGPPQVTNVWSTCIINVCQKKMELSCRNHFFLQTDR